MGFAGGFAGDLYRDLRALLEGDLQTGSCGDCQSDFQTDSQGDS
jgi:hypothetical protein